MSLVLRPPTADARPLPDRLGQLGRARRRAALAAGWFRVVAAAVAAVTVSCALDAAVHLPAVVRAGLLVGTIASVGAAYLRWVRRPGRQSVRPLAVALALEDRFPRLNDALASAVDFLEADATGGSRFRKVAVTRAENLTRRYDLDVIVPTGRAWKAFWLAVLAVAVAVPLGAVNTATARLALTRFADPFGKHPWPTKTTVELLEPTARPGGHYLLAKGDPFALKFAIRGVIPERATVSVRLSGAGVTEDVIPLADGPTIEHRIDANRVPRDFEFRITANDYDTDWLRVAVGPAPKLVPLDGRPSPQVRLEYPEYTDLPPAQLPDGTGVIEAVGGTRIHFRAAADRRIVAASFRNMADLIPVAQALEATAVVGDHPLTALAARMLADEVLADIPVRVTGPEGTILEAEFTPHLPGLYALRMTDEVGLTGVRLFDFRLFPDPAPAVVLERPVAGKDPLTLLPTAAVVVRAHAEDRPFAVKSLVLEYRVGDAPVRTLPLADLEAAWPGVPAAAGGFAVRQKPVAMDGARTVPLSLFRKPDGSPPADGDTISVRAAAADWDTRTALKEPGRSKEVEIRVLGRSALEALFQKELSALRPDLLRLKEEQKTARDKTTETAKAAADGRLKPEDLGNLAQAEQSQRTVRNKVADPDAGLRAKADHLRDTARANNMPRSPTTEKVEAIAEALGRLADQDLEAAEPLLGAARQEAEKPGPNGAPNPDPKKVNDLLTKAGKHQKAAEEGLNNLLQRLEQWGGPGEIRGDAQVLKDKLNQAGNQANKAAEKVPPGKDGSQLRPDEKAELGAPAGKLEEAADQAAALVSKATRIADEKEAQAKALRAAAADKEREGAMNDSSARANPPGSKEADAARARSDAAKAEAANLRAAADRAQAEADALRNAVRDAGGDAIPQDVRQAARDLRNNRPGESAANRQSAANRLDKLTESLTEKPGETPDELRKKRTADGDELDKLGADQDELRKKAKAAEAIPDAGKRAEEMAKLAREQEKLAKKAEEIAQRLTRDKADKSADAVRHAAEQMDAARAELEQGRPPGDKQDEALDRLQEALDKLDREQKQDREQLSREKREQLLDQLKTVREKQKAAIDEAARLQAEAMKAKGWNKALLGSLRDLEDREKNLADELRQYAEKNLTDLPVFNRLSTQSADAMTRAAKYVGQRRDDLLDGGPFDPELEKVNGERIAKPMATALRRLDQILDTLKEDPKAQAANAGGGAGGGGGGGDMGDGGQQGTGIPPLAQLKALRAMQAEVNERTAAFAKDHPDPAKLTEDETDELKELEQAQRDVAELFDKLAAEFRPPMPETP